MYIYVCRTIVSASALCSTPHVVVNAFQFVCCRMGNWKEVYGISVYPPRDACTKLIMTLKDENKQEQLSCVHCAVCNNIKLV